MAMLNAGRSTMIAIILPYILMFEIALTVQSKKYLLHQNQIYRVCYEYCYKNIYTIPFNNSCLL